MFASGSLPLGSLLTSVLGSWTFLAVWGVLVAASLGALVYDLRTNNPFIGPLMQAVWGLTVLYSGPVGLALYVWSGRAQIRRDTLYRKACRSVAHCYSGCGMGEVAGLFIAVGLLSLDTLWMAVLTFALAYAAGFALTVGPLVEEGMGLGEALKDAFYSETASITVMEVAAIGTDILVAGDATMSEPLFWGGLAFSLTVGLAAAYPVNVLLIRYGVKEGMMNPKRMAEQAEEDEGGDDGKAHAGDGAGRPNDARAPEAERA
jgi:hypothetical protein